MSVHILGQLQTIYVKLQGPLAIRCRWTLGEDA